MTFVNRRGFITPSRDADSIITRRIVQGDVACTALAGYCKKRRVAVQAGGNWGYWPLLMSFMFETVYTFEPDAECFAALVGNTRGLKNVIRFQAALGYERKLVDLWRDVDTTGNQRVEGEGVIPTLRIDDLGLTVCDLIYLDIEGMEEQAFHGAENTLGRCHPVVAFEERPVFPTAELRKWLACRNYREIGKIGHDTVMAC